MRWIEAAVPAAGGELDELCARLEALGIDGLSIEDEADFKNFLENNHKYWDYVDEGLSERFAGLSQVKFYLPGDDDGRARLEELRRLLGREIKASTVDDADWESNWMDCYKPLEIGPRLLVVPEWDREQREGRVSLVLDPGLIFGTGSHATTRMCLCVLQDLQLEGARVLDLGCGSGILGIAARLLGCREVRGCDIDEKAPDVASGNAALNGISEGFEIYAGDVLADARLRKKLGDGYDIVLANIVADVIIPLAGLVGGFLKSPGLFVCSGIIEDRQDEVRSALEAAGLSVVEHRCEEEWHCFVCAYSRDLRG